MKTELARTVFILTRSSRTEVAVPLLDSPPLQKTETITSPLTKADLDTATPQKEDSYSSTTCLMLTFSHQ